jgi:RNA polymerase sigma-70 factor (ECF subfamily)
MTIPILSIARWRQTPDEDAAPVAESKKNVTAFAVLYDRYVQSIYRYIYYRVGSVPEAEDLTSQTFLSALEALPSYQHQGNFAAWLYRIAHGKIIDYVRSQQKQAPLKETYLAEANDMLAHVADDDEIEHLWELIHKLEDDEQELIRLRYTAGLPFAQIAAVLDSNENTVKKSLYRIVARLQSQLEDQHHE